MTAIRPSRPDETAAILAIWRRAVDATHDFLTRADRATIDRDVQRLLPGLPMWVAADESDRPLAFMIQSDAKIDGLFVDPAARGRGIGRMLVEHAAADHAAVTVDVNEQNLQAVKFYQCLGFVRTGRSPEDGEGRAYPLLHLRMDRGPRD